MEDRDRILLIVEVVAIVVEEPVEQLDEVSVTPWKGLKETESNIRIAHLIQPNDPPFVTNRNFKSYLKSRTGHSFMYLKKTLGNRLKRLGRIGGDIPHYKVVEIKGLGKVRENRTSQNITCRK